MLRLALLFFLIFVLRGLRSLRILGILGSFLNLNISCLIMIRLLSLFIVFVVGLRWSLLLRFFTFICGRSFGLSLLNFLIL